MNFEHYFLQGPSDIFRVGLLKAQRIDLPDLLHGRKHHFCRHTTRDLQCLGEKHMVLLTEALLLSAGQITSAGYSI